MLVGDAGKLKPRTEVCMFIGYPSGMKGDLFYSPRNQRVIVSMNARFLEKDYILNHKPISKIVLEELKGKVPTSVPTVQEDIPQVTASRVTEDTQVMPRHSGRVVRQPRKFIFLGESFDLVPGKHKPDPWTYNEAFQD